MIQEVFSCNTALFKNVCLFFHKATLALIDQIEHAEVN